MDRKLDAWIAENVDDEGVAMYTLPNYTSDMNESFRVVDKLLSENFRVEFLLQDELITTSISWKEEGPEKYSDLDLLNTPLPMAICLAAYKLKTGKDWNEPESN